MKKLRLLFAFAAAPFLYAGGEDPPALDFRDPKLQIVSGRVLEWERQPRCHGNCLPAPLLRLKIEHAIRGTLKGTVLIDLAMPGEPGSRRDTVEPGDRLIVVIQSIATPEMGWACGRLRDCAAPAPKRLLLGEELFRPVEW